MNDFIYDIPVKVYFGQNQLPNLGPELKRFGTRVLLTYGGGSIKKIGLYDKITAELKRAGLEWEELSGIEPNPRIDSVREGVKLCKEKKIDVLLAVGGGSVIDATKYIAAGAIVDFDPWKFFSDWAPIEKALPLVSVLTLAATGSEMDGGGVISNPETQDKIGRVEPPTLLPKVSFLDPTNTYTVSPYQTACGAVDMMSHIMEVYFDTHKDFYMLDCFMEGMMKTILHYAPIAMKDLENYEARANLMWTSSWAINGFINGSKQQDWSCHPIEHQVSAVYDITHGLGLAILTPRWMEYCLDETNADRYCRFAQQVFGVTPTEDKIATAKEGIARLSAFFFETLGLKSTFTQIGIDRKNFKMMAQKACGENGIHGMKTLYPKDVEAIFEMCL